MSIVRNPARSAILLFVIIIIIELIAPTRTGAFAAKGDLPGNSLNAHLAIAARHACDERAVAVCGVDGFTREQLAEDVARYEILLRVGPGTYDVITVHRLVREHHPGIPIQTAGTFFFLHGSGNRVLGQLLNPAHTAGAGLYLAERNIDVWGMDTRWVRIPRAQTEFSFMAAWGYDKQVGDILLATRFARHLRQLTAQGFGKITLAGHSMGASMAYAAANADAALSANDRDLGGLIPMDMVYVPSPDSAAVRTWACGAETIERATAASAVPADTGLPGIDAGRRALDDPTGVVPPSTLTNRQVALTRAAQLNFAPYLQYHLNSVLRDASNVPNDGRYTPSVDIFGIMAGFVPYRAAATIADMVGVVCGDTAQQHRAHLADIVVPVLYIGFAGGFGEEGLYTLTQLGSSDVTSFIVRKLDASQAKNDWGHADWILGTDAPTLVWDPIWQWIVSRDR